MARQPHPGPSPRDGGGVDPAITLALTAVAFFVVVLDALVVVTALPSIHETLGGGLASLQWTVNAYNVTFAAGIITAAALGDRLGRRRVYVGGLLVFAVASAACALAPDLGFLIGARAVQGLGAAVITPLSLTILTSSFPPERRGAVVGIWGGISGLGVAAGPLIGGAVTQGLSWHWVFWVNVPIAALGALGARLFLPESFGPRTRLDVPGLAMISVGCGAVVWGLVQGSTAGWTSGGAVAGLATGVALLVAFVWWEGRHPEPMIPMHLFRLRSFSAAVGATFLMAASVYSAAFLTSQYFQFALSESPLGTGLHLLPWTATPLVVAPLAGTLSDRVGPKVLMVPGLLLQAVGFAWIAVLVAHPPSYWQLAVPFVVAGVGVSMVLPTSSTAALNAVPPVALGKASGILNTLRQFGAVIGIAVTTAVFSAHGSLATPSTVTAGYRPALAVAALFSLLGVGAAVVIGRSPAYVEPIAAAGAPAGIGEPGADGLLAASSIGRARRHPPAA
jgi:EmrB/QacA subfamily drug resistance transporter